MANESAAEATKLTYSAGAYWDSRYTGPAMNFDWFFNYPALKSLLFKYLPSGKVLHVGCGNSNIQEGMAADGFTVTNVDISPVVIEQMKHQHAGNNHLDYLVADCRDMSELVTGSFHSCVDKGTLDAVLCSQSGQVDAVKYLSEIGRLLRPGGTFVLISLGAPAARVGLLKEELWGTVEVLLLPKPLLYLQSDSSLTGRPLPSSCPVDKNAPIQPLGPWPASAVTRELEQRSIDPRDHFFAYICTKLGCDSAAVDALTPLAPVQQQPQPARANEPLAERKSFGPPLCELHGEPAELEAGLAQQSSDAGSGVEAAGKAALQGSGCGARDEIVEGVVAGGIHAAGSVAGTSGLSGQRLLFAQPGEQQQQGLLPGETEKAAAEPEEVGSAAPLALLKPLHVGAEVAKEPSSGLIDHCPLTCIPAMAV